MFKFIFEPNEKPDIENIEKVEIQVNRHAELDQIIEAFERFLKSVGYIIPENSNLTFLSNDKVYLFSQNVVEDEVKNEDDDFFYKLQQ